MKFKFNFTSQNNSAIKLLLIFINTISVGSVYESWQVLKTGNRVANARELMQYSRKVRELASDNESGFRAYILTGRKSLLAPQEKLQKEIYSKLNYLKRLAENDQAQKARVDSLLYYIDSRISFSNSTIANYQIIGVSESMKLVEVSESKFYFDSVSLLVDGLQDTENASLAVHKAANATSVRSLQRLLKFMIAGIV
jgi:CHASE3 domain sensor protein